MLIGGALASACGGAGETNGTRTDGGAGGAGPHGPQASQLVSGGDVIKSPGYKMIFTLGQPTQYQSKTSSPNYRMRGGVIGANGTLP